MRPHVRYIRMLIFGNECSDFRYLSKSDIKYENFGFSSLEIQIIKNSKK